MLKTKSILDPKKELDGYRISVMSRHTLDDGITPHPNITDSSYDVWFKILAPPDKLIGDYYKRGLPWEQFEQRYLEYLQESKVRIEVENLAQLSIDSVVTILCIEDTPEHCHRRLLAEECKKYRPGLKVSVR